MAPPLGIALRADALSVVMIVVVAVVIAASACTHVRISRSPPGRKRARRRVLVAAARGLGLAEPVFLSGDLFTLYVALELLTFAGVPLVCLDGQGETLRAALRYLVFALPGSVLYLLGAVLIYGDYGVLDIALLAQRVGRRRRRGSPSR